MGYVAYRQRMSLVERQKEIVSIFSGLENWEDRYKRLIEIGRQLPPYPEQWRNEDLKVRGCQSQVWLHAELGANGRVSFAADSDALIVKGLVALLLKLYDMATPEEILATSPDFIKELDFGAHLSPSRSNGLFAMVKQIKFYALAMQALRAQSPN